MTLEFLSYDQIIALITFIVSPLYAIQGYIIRMIIKLGCDITALKTASNIYHKDNDGIE